MIVFTRSIEYFDQFNFLGRSFGVRFRFRISIIFFVVKEQHLEFRDGKDGKATISSLKYGTLCFEGRERNYFGKKLGETRLSNNLDT